MNAAERFREAVGRRDVDAIVATFSPDIRLHTPTRMTPIVGRDRVRMVFAVLVEIFGDFEYTHILAGEPLTPGGRIVSTHALAFGSGVGDEAIEGVDLIDVDGEDRIVDFKVFVRPLPGLEALAEAVRARLIPPGQPAPPPNP